MPMATAAGVFAHKAMQVCPSRHCCLPAAELVGLSGGGAATCGTPRLLPRCLDWGLRGDCAWERPRGRPVSKTDTHAVGPVRPCVVCFCLGLFRSALGLDLVWSGASGSASVWSGSVLSGASGIGSGLVRLVWCVWVWSGASGLGPGGASQLSLHDGFSPVRPGVVCFCLVGFDLGLFRSALGLDLVSSGASGSGSVWSGASGFGSGLLRLARCLVRDAIDMHQLCDVDLLSRVTRLHPCASRQGVPDNWPSMCLAPALSSFRDRYR